MQATKFGPLFEQAHVRAVDFLNSRFALCVRICRGGVVGQAIELRGVGRLREGIRQYLPEVFWDLPNAVLRIAGIYQILLKP